jgi:hypothetical protein
VTRHEGHAKDLLTRSISQASPEDRLLGAQAALAAKKLREWLKELQAWQWPKGLGIQQGKGFIAPLNNPLEFWGSLPTHLVVDYEARLDQIRDGMDGLNVDELKEHIMNVHVPGRSRPSSAHSALSAISAPPFTHVQLSDFTAVITATILRALPTLTRLNMLLDTWTVRLHVLRQIPGLLTSLDAARASLDSALDATQQSQRNKRYSILDSSSRREELVQLIGTAGSRMDTVLDALEGREDSIPETWIDRMDVLEADFASWVQLTGKMAIEKVWVSSEPEVATQPTVEDDELPDATETAQPPDEGATEGDAQTHEDLASPTVNEIVESSPDANTTSQSIEPSPEESPTPLVDVTDNVPTVTADTTSLPMANITDIPDSPTDHENPTPIVTITKFHSPSKSIKETSNPDIATATAEFAQAEGHANSSIAVMEVNNDEQEATDIDTATNHEVKESTIPLRVKKSIPVLEVIGESTSEDSGPESVQNHAEPLISLPLPVPNGDDSDYSHEMQAEASHTTTEDKAEPLPVAMPTIISEIDEKLAHSSREMSSEQLQEHELQFQEITNTNIDKDEVTITSANQISGEHFPKTEAAPTIEPIIGTVKNANTIEGDSSDQTRAHTVEKSNSDVSIPESDAGESCSRHPDSESPHSVMTPSLALEDAAIKETPQSSLIESPIKVMATDSQSFGPFLEQHIPLHPDVPVQSIESSFAQDAPSRPFQSHDEVLPHSRKTSGQSYRSSVPFSPAVFSSTSDRTIREKSSPQLSSSALQDLEAYKHSNDASLPLQRFINDKYDGNYSISHEMHSDSSSSREDTSQYLREETESPRFRNRSESPPPNAIPRRAIRGPSSSLMRGTISSLNKVVGTGKRVESDSFNYESTERVRSRSRLGSPYDVDSEPTPWRRKSSTSDLLQAPKHHLQNQASMESINSYVSSNGTGDMRRRYSFSTDGGSFAIRPVHEADSDLQEKIHSILTTIPGRIRLSNNVARDYDQQSVISSMSSSKKPRLKARSPFSTPSRAGTPTPSEGFTPSSRQRRTVSYKSEDKTVKVYHLHHRGNTEPTKLFVRTVGEDGERVMVRVGGGWADLGEYLREYVMHHGRQTPSSSHVEVKGLPATSTSPGSTTSVAATVIAQTSPKGPASVPTSNRPGSSLSVHKTRRTSKPSELPEVAIDDVEPTTDNLPLPSFPSVGRRTSISSLNSVSVSSILGDGSSVYSPYPGSARTPLSHSSTPLGLAGPKPRTRHVSMTPESEAWVEDVIGQARRTSSITVKPPAQKHTDHRSERELHNSSRMSMRSVSDVPSVSRNKRVVLKGLGAHDRS